MNYFSEILNERNKILIFGLNSQLGQTFNYFFEKSENILQLSSKDVNFLEPNLISNIINDFKPNYIINTSAYTDVNMAESNSYEAFKVNGEALKFMAEAAKNNKSLLIHYSTDYVFDGQNSIRYKPTDIPNPINIYGKSKQTGEQNILKSGCDFVIFRVSWLVSEFGNNFIKTIISKLENDKELFIVNDQIGTPISSKLVANITAKTILLNTHQHSNHIFHLSTKGKVSWYDLAKYIYNFLEKKYKNRKITPILSKKYPTNVIRPQNSLFNHSDIENYLNMKLPSWQEDTKHIINNLCKKLI